MELHYYLNHLIESNSNYISVLEYWTHDSEFRNIGMNSALFCLTFLDSSGNFG